MFQKELPTFELTVNGTQELIDPNVDLKILDGDLVTEFAEQPSKYAFYAGLYTDALVTLEQFKQSLREYEAESEQDVRKRICSRYGENERITEAKMAAEFARDQQWCQLRQAIVEWEKQVLRLEGVKEAFKQRAQMLWNIGATRRQEMVRLNPSEMTEVQ